MTDPLRLLTGSVGSMVLVRPDDRAHQAPHGTGFFVSTSAGAVVITAGHLAVRVDDAGSARIAPPSAALLCDLATHKPIVTAQARRVPSSVSEVNDPATDLMIFERAVPMRAMQPFMLADREPAALEPVFVMTELRGRGWIHPARIVTVLAQGSLAIELDGGMTPAEVLASAGAPIVDAHGRVLGMVTTSANVDGLTRIVGPSVVALRGALGHAGSAASLPAATLVRGGVVGPMPSGSRPPGAQQLEKPSALALWSIAVFVGIACAALAFLFHASFEHDPWYPRALRHVINQNELPFLVCMTLAGMLPFAKVAYARRWFTDS